MSMQERVDEVVREVRRELGDYDEDAVVRAIKARVEQVAHALWQNGGPSGTMLDSYPEFGVVKIGHGRYTVVPKNESARRVKWST